MTADLAQWIILLIFGLFAALGLLNALYTARKRPFPAGQMLSVVEDNQVALAHLNARIDEQDQTVEWLHKQSVAQDRRIEDLQRENATMHTTIEKQQVQITRLEAENLQLRSTNDWLTRQLGGLAAIAPVKRANTLLREIITKRMSEDEIKTLVFDMQINYESLKGTTPPGKVIDLIAYCEMHGQLDALIARIAELRPDIDIKGLRQ